MASRIAAKARDFSRALRLSRPLAGGLHGGAKPESRKKPKKVEDAENITAWIGHERIHSWPVARAFADYDIELDAADLPEGITVVKSI